MGFGGWIRVAKGTERVADGISDLAKRQATDARLTREAIMSLGAVLTDEMRTSREWTLAGQQATLEVQGGLVPPSEYMARTREVSPGAAPQAAIHRPRRRRIPSVAKAEHWRRSAVHHIDIACRTGTSIRTSSSATCTVVADVVTTIAGGWRCKTPPAATATTAARLEGRAVPVPARAAAARATSTAATSGHRGG